MRLAKFWRNLILKIRNVLALGCLLLIYYGYAELCYLISDKFRYFQAVTLFGISLFLGVMGLIYLHEYLGARYDWDAMKLNYLRSLREDAAEELPPHRVYLRATRFVLQKGYWAILFIGPLLLGPFLVTVLLRKHKTWQSNVGYTFFGALYNALFSVALAKGVVALVWRFSYFTAA
jgi:hypothetical protein